MLLRLFKRKTKEKSKFSKLKKNAILKYFSFFFNNFFNKFSNFKKIEDLEQQVESLVKDNADLNNKLYHTQELLAREKIDNQNSLFALHKVISKEVVKERKKTQNKKMYNNIYFNLSNKNFFNVEKMKEYQNQTYHQKPNQV